ncbi:MAG: uroporphyrinogen decarboxylase family protein [Cyclobacteriaceae bacterium]|jgi:uroporphyrinogen-III decarboxylase
MNVKERFLCALRGEIPDRLPVTTHHIMPYFLKKYCNNKTYQEFFLDMGIDPIEWIIDFSPDLSKGEYFDPGHKEIGFLDARRISNDNWSFDEEILKTDKNAITKRFKIITPEKTLSMVLKVDVQSTWVLEHLIKDKKDIEIISKYMVRPKCNVESINNKAREIKDSALLRGHIICFDGFGQPGCWQDASCLYGIQELIMATFEDPAWVHDLLKILQSRKLTYIESLAGAEYDLLELGGGDASTTVISPDIFEDFVAPYDAKLIECAHRSGQRISYHTCGGMMPILEQIASMGPDAMETFTPPAMGGDVKLSEAKKRIGNKVCMIGGFDQFNYFNGCTPELTRKEVRRCFEEAGQDGGYILSPSDHFFDADLDLIKAFSDEARHCKY